MRIKKSIALQMAICILLTTIIVCTRPLDVQAYIEKQGYVTTEDVNVRTGAGTNNAIITKLSLGYEVTVKGEATASYNGATWYLIGFNQNGTYTEGYMLSDYVRIVLPNVDPSEDPDYESYLNIQQFPDSYRGYLRSLHKVHPTWVFVAMPTNLEWSDVVENESKTGVNLVPATSITSWKSLKQDAIDWSTGTWIGKDTSSWVAASEGIVKHYLDPRNFLCEDSRILQFESLHYIEGEQTIQGIANILNGTFMATDDYYRIFMEAGKETGVNPYHLASRCRQEVGKDGSNSTSEIKVNTLDENGYTANDYTVFNGYYNFFNIGAYPTAEHNSMYNGLAYAKQMGWDTPEKSIKGGAAFVAAGYVNKEQDTLYLQKFDVVDGGNSLYSHQYMTNLQAAASEANLMKKAYASLDEATVTYYVPVYLNMPDLAAVKPIDNGSPYSVLSSLSVNGFSLNQEFDGYTSSYTISGVTQAESVDVQATAYAPNAGITGTGTIALTPGVNTITVTCTGTDNSTRTYTIQIEREVKTEPVLGDADLDGRVTAADALKVLRFVTQLDVPDAQQEKLCDVNKNGMSDAGDALMILKYVAEEITSFE